MKRRKFLKAVSTAAGVAALGASKGFSQTNTPPKPAKGGRAKTAQAGQTKTYAMGGIDPSPPPSPFTLRKRLVGWYPDGADVTGDNSCDRLFQEEVIGIKDNKVLAPFPIHFQDQDEASKRWILGKKLVKPEEAPAKYIPFTFFVRRVARLARQYNASLYRLRRLRFYSDYKDKLDQPGTVKWPENNPWTKKPGIPNPKDSKAFGDMVQDAEGDWNTVTNNFHNYLKNTGDTTDKFNFTLQGADMVTANGYIVSMRIVVQGPPSQGIGILEVGGSSSHVSLSSAFSSFSPPP
ncbi:MAG: hypothetical protein C5B50_28655 [Verrucomicrobia bacterium]|nr:MAG: hypothetical protein C5B50_28655 [Verrucomicrobiota bacterium]